MTSEVQRIDEAQRFLLSQMPESARGTIERAYAGTGSPRSAIKAKCLECTFGSRRDIAGCSSRSCPLWKYRPFQKQEEVDGKGGEDEGGEGVEVASEERILGQEATISGGPVGRYRVRGEVRPGQPS